MPRKPRKPSLHSVKGNLALAEPTPPPKQGEIAVSDTRYVSIGGDRFPFIRYNPDDLVGRKGLQIYDQMRADDQVKVCLALKKAAVIGPGWSIQAASDSAGDVALADQITTDLLDLEGNFDDDLWEMLSCLDYGFSLAELVYGQREGRIVLTGIKGRAPHHFDFKQDPFGNIDSIQQLGGNRQQDMPPEKFVHFTNQPEFSNPYGRSDLREAYQWWWFKQQWRQWWAIFGERLADGPIVIKHPNGALNTDITDAIRAADNLQARTSIAIPEGWEMEVLAANRDPKGLYETGVNRCDLGITKAVLIPDKMGIAGGEVEGGSYALGKAQLGVFFFVLDLLKRRLECIVQERIVRSMLAFEAPEAEEPKFVINPLSEESREATVSAIVALAAGNVITTDVRDENVVRKLLKLPEVEETADQLREAVLKRKQDMDQSMIDKNRGGLGDGDGDGMPLEKETRDMAEQPLVPVGFSRPLTLVEKRADLAEKKRTFEELTRELGLTIGAGVRLAWSDLRDAVTTAIGNPRAIERLRFSSRSLMQVKAETADGLEGAYRRSLREAEGEVNRARRFMSDPITFAAKGLVGPEAQKYFDAKSLFVTGVWADDILKRAKQALFNALRGDKTDRQVLYEVDQAVAEYLPQTDRLGRVVNVPHRIETIARTNVAEAVAEGRWAAFNDPDLDGFVTAVMYSAVLDDRTRDRHAAWDGVTRPIDDPIWFGPPDNRPLNGFNCRCILTPVTAIDDVQMTPDSELPRQPAADPGFK